MPKFTKDNLRNTFSAIFSDQQVTNMNKMYDYLKNTLKWSDRNIAAAMGNAYLESGYNYDLVSSMGAKGAFQFLGERQTDYDQWRADNGYLDGALSQATYLNHVLKDTIDPRMDSVIKARELAKSSNKVDLKNALDVLSWAEPALKNGTFYPVVDLITLWNDPKRSLADATTLWSRTIERPGKAEAKESLRVDAANKIYGLITKKNGGELNYFNYFN